MSGTLVRAAVRDLIRSRLGIQDRQCLVTDSPGNAPPDASQLFIAIHPGRWRRWGAWKLGPTFDEEFACRVTVSVKAGAIQPQWWGEKFIQKACAISSCGAGIEAICREIATMLHDNDELACALNTQVGDTQFTGGLFFADGGEAESRTASWWRCPTTKEAPAIGLSQTLYFDGLRRTQASQGAN